MRAGHQAREVEDQGRRQCGVAALPGGLQDHPGTEEAVEGDVVPGGLPVAEGRYVVDVDLALRGPAQGVREDPFLAGVLGRGGGRVGEEAPSPPPSRLVPDQARTSSARCANIGPSTDRSRVWPVLPSRPAYGRRPARTAEASAGWCRPVDGVKFT